MNKIQTRCLGAFVMLGCLATACWAQTPPATAPAPSTPAKAQRVLLIGDSLMKGFAPLLEAELSKQPNTVTRSCVEIGTGVTRLDLFNWHQKISELTKEFTPNIAVVWMGGNDIQPLKTTRGVFAPGSPEWASEYAKRVGLAMDLLIAGGVQRVYWMELPDMRDEKLQTQAEVIRDIQSKEAKQRPEVLWQPVRNLIGQTPGKYTQYITTDNGLMNVRTEDGIHLTPRGYKYLAAKITPLTLP